MSQERGQQGLGWPGLEVGQGVFCRHEVHSHREARERAGEKVSCDRACGIAEREEVPEVLPQL